MPVSLGDLPGAAQALLDERVLRCTVTLTLPANGVLSLVANVTTAAGQFTMVVNATTLAQNNGQSGVQMLLVSP